MGLTRTTFDKYFLERNDATLQDTKLVKDKLWSHHGVPSVLMAWCEGAGREASHFPHIHTHTSFGSLLIHTCKLCCNPNYFCNTEFTMFCKSVEFGKNHHGPMTSNQLCSCWSVYLCVRKFTLLLRGKQCDYESLIHKVS